MTHPETNGDCAFPQEIVDAVTASVLNTCAAYCGERPTPIPTRNDVVDGPCVAGIISFFGDIPWSLSWILSEKFAPALAQKFAGFDIPFDSPDMGDMAGELVNVLAGEVVSQLQQRRIKAQMSLPTVARGSPLQLIPEKAFSVARLDFNSKEGAFWLRLAVAKNGKLVARVSGA